jgi:hypothetical protein
LNLEIKYPKKYHSDKNCITGGSKDPGLKNYPSSTWVITLKNTGNGSVEIFVQTPVLVSYAGSISHDITRGEPKEAGALATNNVKKMILQSRWNFFLGLENASTAPDLL